MIAYSSSLHTSLSPTDSWTSFCLLFLINSYTHNIFRRSTVIESSITALQALNKILTDSKTYCTPDSWQCLNPQFVQNCMYFQILCCTSYRQGSFVSTLTSSKVHATDGCLFLHADTSWVPIMPYLIIQPHLFSTISHLPGNFALFVFYCTLNLSYTLAHNIITTLYHNCPRVG